MTKAGFLLYDLRPASHHPHFKGDWGYYPREVLRVPAESSSLTKRITEADGVYFRRPELILQGADEDALRRQLVLLCVYGFFIDALQLIERARTAGLFNEKAALECHKAVLDWHASARDLLIDNPVFDKFQRSLKQLSHRIQGKLLGRRFYRWRE
jgi:hypothetical protein